MLARLARLCPPPLDRDRDLGGAPASSSTSSPVRRPGLPHRLHAARQRVEGRPGPARAGNPNTAGFSQIVVEARPNKASTTPRCRRRPSSRSSPSPQEGVTVTSPYDNPQQISPDGTIAFAQLDIDRSRLRGGDSTWAGDRGLRRRATGDVEGLTIEYGGDLFGEFELPESEIYGIIAAVIILILAFGSVLAMGLPIGTACSASASASPRLARSATSSRCPTSRRWWR